MPATAQIAPAVTIAEFETEFLNVAEARLPFDAVRFSMSLQQAYYGTELGVG